MEPSIDFETRSTVDLRKTGVYPYALCPHTDVWCMAYAFEDDDPEVWRPGEPFPARLREHVEGGGRLRAWNAQFERIIWREIMVPRYGAPPTRIETWVDTAVEAAAMGLPRALERCAAATGVPAQKDKKGHNLMLRMARPRKVLDDGTPVWWEDPERIARLEEYCRQDVRTERAMVRVLRRLSAYETEAYWLDQRMNDRGVCIDRELVLGAKALAEEGVRRANEAFAELTSGSVTATTQVQGIRRWLASEGLALPNLSKATVEAALASGELGERLERALVLRSESGKSSIAKLDSMLAVAHGPDDRLSGLLLFCGAGTGRWSGRLTQPQNFPRPELDDIECLLDLIRSADYDILDLLHPPVKVVSDALRSMLVPHPGMEFTAGDYSAIEARVLNWLAGQEDMLQVFREYDAGDKTKDPYVRNAMRLFSLAFEDVKKFPHRQTGKFQELGCGFQMGAEKAVQAAQEQYGLTITREEADAIVSHYRMTHADVVSLWSDLQRAAFHAVERPGETQDVGKLRFVKLGGYLYLILPSKRPLCYAQPKIEDVEAPWGEMVPAVTAYTAKGSMWFRRALYGGLLAENATQAVARDVMLHGMFNVEKAGYDCVLTVHDEVVGESPIGTGDPVAFARCLTDAPSWAHGLPIASETWTGMRYRK